jgi:hypothetical protein
MCNGISAKGRGSVVIADLIAASSVSTIESRSDAELNGSSLYSNDGRKVAWTNPRYGSANAAKIAVLTIALPYRIDAGMPSPVWFKGQP